MIKGVYDFESLLISLVMVGCWKSFTRFFGEAAVTLFDRVAIMFVYIIFY